MTAEPDNLFNEPEGSERGGAVGLCACADCAMDLSNSARRDGSDLFELSYETVGELDSRLKIVTDWGQIEPLGHDILSLGESGSGYVCGILGSGRCSPGADCRTGSVKA